MKGFYLACAIAGAIVPEARDGTLLMRNPRPSAPR
jgi:hypothetical protein